MYTYYLLCVFVLSMQHHMVGMEIESSALPNSTNEQIQIHGHFVFCMKNLNNRIEILNNMSSKDFIKPQIQRSHVKKNEYTISNITTKEIPIINKQKTTQQNIRSQLPTITDNQTYIDQLETFFEQLPISLQDINDIVSNNDSKVSFSPTTNPPTIDTKWETIQSEYPQIFKDYQSKVQLVEHLINELKERKVTATTIYQESMKKFSKKNLAEPQIEPFSWHQKIFSIFKHPAAFFTSMVALGVLSYKAFNWLRHNLFNQYLRFNPFNFIKNKLSHLHLFT